MSNALQHRRGTTAQHASFTGALAEVTVDTDKKALVVHDGATPGGHPVLPQSRAVAKTADTGAALLPEGTDAQRPATGSIPAGALVARGNTQDGADYKPEFWNRVAEVWQALASRPWVQAITDALGLRITALETKPQLRACGAIRGQMTPATGYALTGCTIVDDGVGDYRVVLSTPAPHEHYAIGTVLQPSESSVFSYGFSIYQKTVNGFRIRPTGSASGYIGVDWNTYKTDVFNVSFTVHY